jgi:hypothetical protein
MKMNTRKVSLQWLEFLIRFLWLVCEKDLSQTGAVFPIEESWISKSLLLKLPGKELAPNPEKEEP